MEIIIASDIFGKTPELEEFVSKLSTDANKATVVDPYEGKYLNFENENEAYRYFEQTVGIERYKDILFEATSYIIRDLLIIGFSVGASAIWAISHKFGSKPNTKAIIFYGSQIRHFAEVNPKIHMELIFPKHEPHFNVDDLIAQISLIDNVRCSTASYLHGFMNKRSANFNMPAYEYYLNRLKNSLADMRASAL
jgi:dienelactone hydrolase